MVSTTLVVLAYDVVQEAALGACVLDGRAHESVE
jgi:hypothetical protein